MVQITGIGTVKIEASQSGDSNYLPATLVVAFDVDAGSAIISSLLNAASYGSGSLASNEYAVLFGAAFTTGSPSSATPPYPSSLGGVTVTVLDSDGTAAPASVVYVSSTQVNFVVPADLAPGKATVTVLNGSGQSMTFATDIAAVAPALFTADASGKGAPAALTLSIASDGTVQSAPVFACTGTPVACAPTPIDVSAQGMKVYLTLYGTGIRGRSELGGVSVTFNGTPLKVLYAGSQPTFPGLDQVNVLLDSSLAGTGSGVLQVTVDGVAANPVALSIQ